MDADHARSVAPPRKPQPQKPVVSKRRKWVFRLIALGLPFLFLLVGEIICRFAGYGGYPPVLRKMQTFEGRTYVASYPPGIATFFFENLSVVGGMAEQVFTDPKPDGAVRIFALGGSAMRGYPEPPSLAATSFLHAMLADLWPDRQIEVLNLGTTAVASFPVMYMLDEALEYQPDLVVVYTGNNEFYGAGGVASVHAFGRSARAMRLFRLARRTALVQWITDVVTRHKSEPTGPGQRDLTLMERVVADSQIPPNDSRRAAAARNLENHVAYIVARCREHGVPVILCTLPANERDLAPLGEDVLPRLPDAEQARFESLLAKGRQALPDDPSAAFASLESASRLYDKHATLHFLMGKALTALGRHDEALKQYTQAKDLDTMPWRAPSAASEAIRRVAKNAAILCDLERVFQKHSPVGAIGWELMDDHVHPTLRGQALIARTWLQAMEQLPEPLRVGASEAAALPTWEEYAARFGDNEYDRYVVAHRMLNLFESSFYAKSNPKAVAWREAQCAEFEAGLSDEQLRAVRYWQDPGPEGAAGRPLTGIVGAVLMAEGKFAEANRLFMIARRNVSRFSLWNLELTWKALVCRRHLHPEPQPEDLALAGELLADGLELGRATGVITPELHRHLGLAYNLLGMHEPAVAQLSEAVRFVKDSKGLVVIEALVDSLVRTGQRERALGLLQTYLQNPQLRDGCARLLARVEAETATSKP